MPDSIDTFDDWYDDDEYTCWNCYGEGHTGSACIDDLCHGGEVPCKFHGDSHYIRCDVCDGKGEI